MAYIRHYIMRASPENADALREVLGELRDVVAALDGSLRIDMHRVIDAPEVYHFVEYWTDKDAHAAAGKKLPRDLMTILKTLLAAPPQATELTD